MSHHNLAVSETLSVDFMDGYFQEQIKPDYDHDPKRWWEVINRTTRKWFRCPSGVWIWNTIK